jgi:hypothetical protein
MQTSVSSTIPEVGQRLNHPVEELVHRARDPQWVADCALRLLTQAWDSISPSEFSGLYRRVRRRTMCSNARLRGLYRGVKYVVDRGIAGDFVECGCALGGSAALIGLTLRQRATRRLWLFDTFEGLPAPTSGDPDFEIANLFTGTCVGTVDEVRSLFLQLGIEDGVQFVKGLFQETLPNAGLSQIALLHVDGDWYESVKSCLDNLYDKVVPGGVIQFDDYGYWAGARKAVDEFMQTRNIQAQLTKLDYAGRVLIKPLFPGAP